MIFFAPAPEIVYYEILEILSQDEGEMDERKREMIRQIKDKEDENIYKSLHKITKLPKHMKPTESSKVCGFVDISC